MASLSVTCQHMISPGKYLFGFEPVFVDYIFLLQGHHDGADSKAV